MGNKKCEKCIHWCFTKEVEGKDYNTGFCRRYPPTYVHGACLFPVTDSNWLCGEHDEMD